MLSWHVCTRLQISGSSDKIGRENGLQPELLEGDVNHSKITKHKYIELRDVGEPYLESDDLSLAFVYARPAKELQEVTEIGIEEFLTEPSLGCKCFGIYNRDRKIYLS